MGEFLILIGTFETHPVAAFVATTGVIFAAAYMLPMLQRVLYGPITHEANEDLEDLSGRERLVLAPLLLLIVGMGVFPGTETSVGALIQQVELRSDRAPASMHAGDLRFDRMPILNPEEAE